MEAVRSGSPLPPLLRDALDAVPEPSLADSLRPVVRRLPAVASVEVATVRVADERGRLHLVAAVGCPPGEVRARALEPLEPRVVRRLIEDATVDAYARTLGIEWVRLRLLGEPMLGTLLVGCRSDRRPDARDLVVVDAVADELGARLESADRSEEVVRASALRLARDELGTGVAPPVDEGVSRLRRRERQVLELYADGLSTQEIAALLVVSPHTVRTHVKSALRTLDLHARADAAARVRASQVLRLP